VLTVDDDGAVAEERLIIAQVGVHSLDDWSDTCAAAINCSSIVCALNTRIGGQLRAPQLSAK
jgi:hypothetical protein